MDESKEDSLNNEQPQNWDQELKQKAEASDKESDVSQSQIGSLVSYTINYMDKKSKKGKELVGIDEQDKSSNSDQNSLIVERESEGRSSTDDDDSIDTIHEEVDISASEGSDAELVPKD